MKITHLVHALLEPALISEPDPGVGGEASEGTTYRAAETRVFIYGRDRLGSAQEGGTAMSLNKVFILGYLGQDPTLRYTTSGKAVGRLSVATNARWQDAEGGMQQHTEWHQVVVWNRAAENCRQFLAVGNQVFIEGALHTRTYEDKDGQQRMVTEIVARRVVFLDTGKNQENADPEQGITDDAVETDPSPFDEVPW